MESENHHYVDSLVTRKLELQIREFQRPFYDRPTFWLTLAGVLIAFFGFVFERERTELKVAYAENQVAVAKIELNISQELKREADAQYSDAERKKSEALQETKEANRERKIALDKAKQETQRAKEAKK